MGEFKVGDTVKIIGLNKMWHAWVPGMDETVGRIGVVKKITPEFDSVRVCFSDDFGYYWYPLNVLLRVNKPKTKRTRAGLSNFLDSIIQELEHSAINFENVMYHCYRGVVDAPIECGSGGANNFDEWNW
jgi:hypothetical protein